LAQFSSQVGFQGFLGNSLALNSANEPHGFLFMLPCNSTVQASQEWVVIVPHSAAVLPCSRQSPKDSFVDAHLPSALKSSEEFSADQISRSGLRRLGYSPAAPRQGSTLGAGAG